MANMSYCMYENTALALSQVFDDLEERSENNGLDEYEAPLSKTEAEAKMRIIQLCESILEVSEREREESGNVGTASASKIFAGRWE